MNDQPASSKTAGHENGGVYRAILESTGQGYCTIEVAFDENEKPIDYRFLEVSSSFERLTGIENGAGRWMREIAADQDQFWFDTYGRVAQSGKPERFESFSTPLDRWFSVNALKIEGPARIAVLFDDITERKRNEAAQRESEVKYRSLFDTMGQGYALVELVRNARGEAIDQRYLEFNPAVERLLGVSPSDAVGKLGSQVFVGMEPNLTDTFDRVVRDCAPGRIEQYFSPLGRWFEINAYPAGGDRFIALYDDVTDRKHAELVLRESEERQAFLLTLSDTLRPLADPSAVQAAAAQLLGEHLKADRALYYEVDADGITLTLQGYSKGGITLPEKIRIADLGQQWLETYLQGRNVIVSDIATDERASDEERAVWRASGLCGALGVPLVKDGRFCALLGFNSAQPRRWTDAEVKLVEEVAERTWTAVGRAQSEAELRESETRFRALAESIEDVFYITDLDLNQLLYLSPAYEKVFGRSVDSLLADLNSFGGSIHPDDLDTYLVGKAKQSGNEPVTTEYRIIHPDGEVRWIYDRSFPIEGRGRRRASGVATDITERRRAVEIQGTLLEELQHRVRNILALIQSVVQRTAETSESPEEFALHLEGRISAMARTQALLTRSPGREVDLEDIIQDELLSVAAQEGQFWCEGPLVMLSPKAAEILTLAIHELTTNAIKYGAFACSGGQLEIRWDVADRGGQDWLIFEWEECRVPKTSMLREGFGSELINRKVPYELRGKGSLKMGENGIKAKIEFPLQASSSILETGMPERPQ